MQMPKWPKTGDEWRGAILFLIAAPLLTFEFLIGPIQDSLRSSNLFPQWRLDIFFEFTGILAIPMLLGVVALTALTIVYLFIDRYRAVLTLLFLLIFCIWMPALARAREKPVIYLYPKKEQVVHVSLAYPGRITESEPPYGEDGWRVMAAPDGTLHDLATGTEHRFLFWEGRDRISFRMDTGFVVPGNESEPFLREKLALMGLSTSEADDFVAYWLPRLAAHPYNLISFPNEEYAEAVGLEIEPAPDTIIRVFMVFRGIESPIDVPPQTFHGAERHGFTVVEWGGTELE